MCIQVGIRTLFQTHETINSYQDFIPNPWNNLATALHLMLPLYGNYLMTFKQLPLLPHSEQGSKHTSTMDISTNIELCFCFLCLRVCFPAEIKDYKTSVRNIQMDMRCTGYGVMFATHPCLPGMSFHPESHIQVSNYKLHYVEQNQKSQIC